MPLVELSTGVSLDVIWTHPSVDEGDVKLAVCSHPWSWFGGRKEDPVLHLATEVLVAHSYHVLRFDSRGVGKSSGRVSFTGLPEAKDLEQLVEYGIKELGSVQRLILMGYSHGSLVTSLHPIHPTVKTSHLLLSYPLSTRMFLTLFNSSLYASKLRNLIGDRSSNVLVVYGDQDEFTGLASYTQWKAELEGYENASRSLRVTCIKDGSHFWRGRCGIALQDAITEWLEASS